MLNESNVTAISVASEAEGSIRISPWFWACKGAIVSVLSGTTAYGLWVYYGRPDFYIRGFHGEVPLTILLSLFLWVPIFFTLYVARHELRVHARTRPVLRFLGFVVLTTAVITVFHLLQFRLYLHGFHLHLPESAGRAMVYIRLGVQAALVVGATLLSELLGKPIEKGVPLGSQADRE